MVGGRIGGDGRRNRQRKALTAEAGIVVSTCNTFKDIY